MKLLILTQKVDKNDPVLGFFHRWIREFAKHFEEISVVALGVGEYDLPENVRVYSLGKESGASRLTYVFNFYRYVFTLRYDAVFVHASEEYVMLGGLLWRLAGKKVVLRRIFKTGSWMTPVACAIVNTLDCTSHESFTARYSKAVYTSVGIDTGLFSLGEKPAESLSILFLGRIDPVKRVEVFLDAMRLLSQRGITAHADIYGDPTPGHEAYAQDLKRKYADLANVSFYPSVPNTQTPPLYRSHAVYVNITPSGSLDKTIGEAMACGAAVVCMNDSVRDVLPKELMAGDTAETTAQAIRAALEMDADARRALAYQCSEWIEREQSLTLLAQKLADIFGSNQR